MFGGSITSTRRPWNAIVRPGSGSSEPERSLMSGVRALPRPIDLAIKNQLLRDSLTGFNRTHHINLRDILHRSGSTPTSPRGLLPAKPACNATSPTPSSTPLTDTLEKSGDGTAARDRVENDRCQSGPRRLFFQ